MVGRVNAHERGFALTRSSSSTLLAWGMSTHLPVSSKRHAWYAQSSVPSSSTRPSESGARRCGHLSSNTLHLPSPSFHTTTSTPRSCVGCGLLVSSRSITATGYHCLVQLNVPASGVSPRAAASTIGMRSGVMPISGFAVDASAASSSAAMVEPPAEATVAVRRACTADPRAARTTETRRLAAGPSAALRVASVAGRDDVIIFELPTTRACRAGQRDERACDERLANAPRAGRARRRGGTSGGDVRASRSVAPRPPLCFATTLINANPAGDRPGRRITISQVDGLASKSNSRRRKLSSPARLKAHRRKEHQGDPGILCPKRLKEGPGG